MTHRRGILFAGAVFLVLVVAALSALIFADREAPLGLEGFDSATMRITSPSFGPNAPIPGIHTCDGENVSPRLDIEGVPEAATSLALIVDDPDAPLGTWVHWTVWNIPPRTSTIAQGGVPAGAVEGRTSFGKPGYGGPCPPTGLHRYYFKLYALDAALSLPPTADARELEAAIAPHVIDKAALMGVYRRK